MMELKRSILLIVCYSTIILLMSACNEMPITALPKADTGLPIKQLLGLNPNLDMGSGSVCQKDKFQQADATAISVQKVDILFVMDHSGSMSDNWQTVATNIESFAQKLPAGVDVEIAVMLGDVDAQRAGALFAGRGQPLVLSTLTLTTSAIATSLQHTFHDAMNISDSGSGEAAFYSLYQAVTNPNSLWSIKNAGFFRDDAALSVVFMSDENEIGNPGALEYLKPDAAFEAGIKARYYDANGITTVVLEQKLRALKGAMPLAAHAFVNITTDDLYAHNPVGVPIYDSLGYGYMDIVHDLGGVLYSIEADQAQGMLQIATFVSNSITLQHDFALTWTADKVNAASITAMVDGQYVAGSYDPSTDTVHLDNAGVAASKIEIDYCQN